MSNSPQPSLLWLNKHPILEEGHARDLEQNAALNEFHRKMPRDAAEGAAHDEYRKTHHTRAAAHHFAGMRAAQGAGDMEEAKKHGDHYAQHMKALGHDPHGPVPEHIRLQASDPKHSKVYRFANHAADSLLSGSLSKAEGKTEKCKHCGGTGHDPHGRKYKPQSGPAKFICESCNGSGSVPAGTKSGPRGMPYVGKSEDEKPQPKCKQCGKPFKNPVDAMLSSKHLVCADCTHQNHKRALGKSERLAKAPDRFQLLDIDNGGPRPEDAFKTPPQVPPQVPLAPAESTGARRARQDATFERDQLASGSKTVREHTFTPGPAQQSSDPTRAAALADEPAPEDVPEQRLAVNDPKRYFFCEDCRDHHDVYGGYRPTDWNQQVQEPEQPVLGKSERLQRLLHAAKLVLKLHAARKGMGK